MICLYVDAYGAERDEWAKTGSSPYLDLFDQPDNLVRETTDQDESGDYGFEDLPTGHPIVVELQLHCRRESGSGSTITVYIHDGTSWNNAGIITPDYTYSTKTLDVSSILDTRVKLQAAKMYLVYNA
jgi:hypothetical protein